MNSICQYCGGSIHTGLCPKISSVIYHPNGAVEYVMWKCTPPPVIVQPSFTADGKAGTAPRPASIMDIQSITIGPGYVVGNVQYIASGYDGC